MVPPHQRLEPAQRAVLDRDDRLVEDPQLVALEHAPHCVLHAQAAQHPRAHCVVEELAVRVATLLCAVHRGVGIAEQGVRVLVAAACHGDADARAQEVRLVVDVERLGKGLLDALGYHQCVTAIADLLAQHDELVAAEAGHGVTQTQRRLNPAGDRLEQSVAGVVPEAVVDELEVVDVHEHDRRVPDVGPPAGQHVPEAIEEERPVGKAGQRVVQRVVADGLLGVPAGHRRTEDI